MSPTSLRHSHTLTLNMSAARLALAQSMMLEHGLLGWSLVLDNARTRAGSCTFTTKTISISRVFMGHADTTDAVLKNVVLHEIAHAKAGHAAGHGPVWRGIALEIGCDGTRCMASAFSQGRYRIVCPCGKVDVTRHKISNKLLCRKCRYCKSTLRCDDTRHRI